MRYLILMGICCLAGCGVAAASTLDPSEVVVTFEETDAGLRMSFEARVDLAGLELNPDPGFLVGGFLGEPFGSHLTGSGGFGLVLTSASSAADIQEYFTLGTFEFAFKILGEFFGSTDALDETGDNFGVGVLGTDVPFLAYAVPEGYVSNTPLSGSATYVGVSLSEVAPLLGTHPLDIEGSRTITFRVSEGLPGDYSGDGVVDAADYVVWRNHEGTEFDLPNRNPDVSGVITDADYDFWVSNFGNSSSDGPPGTTTAIPEPRTVLMLLCVAISLGMVQPRRPPEFR